MAGRACESRSQYPREKHALPEWLSQTPALGGGGTWRIPARIKVASSLSPASSGALLPAQAAGVRAPGGLPCLLLAGAVFLLTGCLLSVPAV